MSSSEPNKTNFDYNYYEDYNSDVSILYKQQVERKQLLWQHWTDYGKQEGRPHKFKGTEHSEKCCPTKIAYEVCTPTNSKAQIKVNSVRCDSPTSSPSSPSSSGYTDTSFKQSFRRHPHLRNRTRGLLGQHGPPGPPGPPGCHGLEGLQGLQGSNGVDGAAGVDGTDGTNGATGDQGPQGEHGGKFKCLETILRGTTITELVFGQHVVGDSVGQIRLVLSTGNLYSWDGSTWEILNGVGSPYYLMNTNTNIIYCVDGFTLPTPTIKNLCDLSTGDQILDGSNGDLFSLEQDCTWLKQCKLNGPQGPQGSDGNDGSDGSDGGEGVKGPQGNKGDKGNIFKCFENIQFGKTVDSVSDNTGLGDYDGQLCLVLDESVLFQWCQNGQNWKSPIDNPPTEPYIFRDDDDICTLFWYVEEETQQNRAAENLVDQCGLNTGDQVLDGITGYFWELGVSGCWEQGCNLVGPQGASGTLEGPQGDQGDQGDQGNMGPQGDQGDQGNQGPQGNQGDLGPQGDQGDVGPQGDSNHLLFSSSFMNGSEPFREFNTSEENLTHFYYFGEHPINSFSAIVSGENSGSTGLMNLLDQSGNILATLTWSGDTIQFEETTSIIQPVGPAIIEINVPESSGKPRIHSVIIK